MAMAAANRAYPPWASTASESSGAVLIALFAAGAIMMVAGTVMGAYCTPSAPGDPTCDVYPYSVGGLEVFGWGLVLVLIGVLLGLAPRISEIEFGRTVRYSGGVGLVRGAQTHASGAGRRECPACGSENLPTSVGCYRCGAPLTPSGSR